MFGEKPILGHYDNRKIDIKGRITIGNITKAEPFEELCILKEAETQSEVVFRVILLETIRQEILRIKKFKENAKNMGELKKCCDALEKIYENVYRTTYVDQQGRLQIGSADLNGKTASLVGEIDSLKITVHR